MEIRQLVPSSIVSLACIGLACNGGGSGGPIEDPGFDSDSFGLDTSGAGNNAGDGQGADGQGVDETGDGGPVAADHCLVEPIDDRYGYKYQCEGSVAVAMMIEGNFPGSPVTPPPLQLEFGHGMAGDSYEEPHVMACCPPYDETAPNCGQPHERACIIDLVEQGCKSIIVELEDFAHDELTGIANQGKRNAVLKIAQYVRDNQDDCFSAFLGPTGLATTLPECDMDGNGLGFDSMLESGVWSFDPDGIVDQVVITVQAANWTDIYPRDGSPEICWSADENDGVLFLEIDPRPGSKMLQLVTGGAFVHGPWMEGGRVEGFVELSPGTSQIALHVDPDGDSATLEGVELHAAGAASVGTADGSWSVERFQVRLWDRTAMQRLGEAFTIPAGLARFAVSATAVGVSGVITATNSTPIMITQHGSEWSSSSFTIDYQDAGEHADHVDHWSLVINPAQWH